jgi:CheY-like chemotaxis protein
LPSTLVVLSLDSKLAASLRIAASLRKETTLPGADIEIICCDKVEAAVSSLAGLAGQRVLPVLLVDLFSAGGFTVDTVAMMVRDFPAVPVVAVVARNRDDLEYEALAAGACDYLIKGVITPSIFARTLRSASNYWSSKSLVYEGLEKAKILAQAIPLALMLVDRSKAPLLKAGTLRLKECLASEEKTPLAGQCRM